MSLLIGTTSGLFHLEGRTPLIKGTRINQVVRFENDWWAVDGKGRIHHNGEIAAQMPDDAIAICIQPTPDTVWIGSDRARLFGLEQGAIEEDEFFAVAPGRDRWHTPWGAPADVRSMTVDADSTLYVNVHVGGILRYDDSGLVPTVDIESDVHQVMAHPTEKGAVFAATAYGLAQSHNGHDFEFRTEGMHAKYCRAVAVSGDRVLISASTGPRGDKARLYATSLWEGPLVRVSEGLPSWFDDNLDTHCLIASDGVIHAGVGDTVWRSDDSGDTWAEAASGLPKITSLA